MKRQILPLLAALAIAAGTPVTAGAVNAADYVVWRTWQPGQKAIVLLEATSAGARISGAIKGLDAGANYELIGTNADGDCSTGVNAGNRTLTLSVLGNTHANGTFFKGSVSGQSWKDTRFIRIREHNGPLWACRSSDYGRVGPDIHDLAFSRFVVDGELKAIVLVEPQPNDRGRVFVAAGDVNGDGVDDLRVRGTSKACGHSGGAILSVVLEDVLVSSFASRVVQLSQTQLDALASVRITKLTGNLANDWFGACRKSILIALLVP